MKKSLLAILSAILACAACSKKEEPAAIEPVVRTVSVESSALEIPPGGSAILPFKVEDKEAVFQEVKLLLDGGREPEEFFLQEIARGTERGTYQAVIQDAGFGKNYERDVHLAILQRNPSTGNEYYVPSSTFRVFSEAFPPGTVETGLPIVYVNTEGGKGIYSKEEYVKASLKIRGTEQYDGLDEITCSIRGRGNTTWEWPKKPYLLKLDEKQSLFGMPKHKRWILLANFMDRTIMRNLVSMKVASMMSNLAWTPGCVPVELVLNGKHVGSYLLIEQVRVDKKRVAVTEMTPEDNVGDAVTGGYLLELDFHYDNEVQWVDPHGHNNQWGDGVPFGVKYPDPEDLTPQQLAYIKGYIAETANTLYGGNFKDPDEGYAKYIDVDSFIDYWIVFEVMGNHELGNPGSVYMHKDRNGKLVAGPCWDFDWGVLSYNTSPHARTGLVNGNAIWYARLRQDPAFEAKLKARFDELLPKLETIPAYIDECEKLLTESARLNFAMWNPADDASQNGGYIINGDENMSFHNAVARLKSIYQERLRVIPKNL
jgi:hypothetical protein